MADDNFKTIIADVAASLVLEDLYVPEDFIDIMLKYLKGEISEKEVLCYIEKQ